MFSGSWYHVAGWWLPTSISTFLSICSNIIACYASTSDIKTIEQLSMAALVLACLPSRAHRQLGKLHYTNIYLHFLSNTICHSSVTLSASVPVPDGYIYTPFSVGMKYVLGKNWKIPEMKDTVGTFSLFKYGYNREYFYIVLPKYNRVTDVCYTFIILNVTNYEKSSSSRFIIVCAIIQFSQLSSVHFVPDPSYIALFFASWGFTVRHLDCI
jgi:hypothetical protein